MTEWFSADQHFGHEAVLQFCDRPFKNIDHMDKMLIKNHNELVQPDEDVYYIGDFAWWGPQKADRIGNIIKKLNGKKHLILGNHDRLKPFTYIEYGFTSVHTSLSLHEDKFVLAHDPSVATILNRGQTLICGHVHQLFRQVGNAYNVGVDVHDYKPVSLTQIISELFRNSTYPPPKKSKGSAPLPPTPPPARIINEDRKTSTKKEIFISKFK
jgi:calcineurin-like phosphoesterase family protein